MERGSVRLSFRAARRRTLILLGLCATVAAAVLLHPAIGQDPSYHRFFDTRAVRGIPNFWNVATNAGFVAVGVCGLAAIFRRRSFRAGWERGAYALVMVAAAFTGLGSACYHLEPGDGSLVWDRLPMAVLFMALTALVAGERVSTRAGRALVLPLVGFGVGSVAYWHASGDLRLYVLAQFVPLLMVPLMAALFPAAYTREWGLWAMVGAYGLAKAAEMGDGWLGGFVATGGHPWKHVLAAAGLGAYALSVALREPYSPAAAGSSSKKRSTSERVVVKA